MIRKSDFYTALIGLGIGGVVVMALGRGPGMLIFAIALFAWYHVGKFIDENYHRVRPIVAKAEEPEMSEADTKAFHILFKICPPKTKRTWWWQVRSNDSARS
jgi:hypothetical protein